MPDYFGESGRWLEVPIGLFALAAAGFGLFFGVSGLVSYAHGSREAPSDPLACAIGIAGGLLIGFYGLKLVLNRSRHGVLLSNVALLLAGLVCLGGAAGMMLLGHATGRSVGDELLSALGIAGIGLSALSLWWRRVHDEV